MSNNDDFGNDQVDFDDVPEDSGFEDFEGGGTTLGDMWRNNPLVKIGVIAGGLITIIGAIILFGGGNENPLRSTVRGGQDVSEPPGGEISQEYEDALTEANIDRTETAIREGGSAIPTPIDSPVSRLNLPEDEGAGEDPLERWRRIQEERQRQVTQKKPDVAAGDPYAGAIDALAGAMATQMESILGTKEPLEPIHMLVTEVDFFDKEREAEAQRAAENAAMLGAGEEVVNILLPAGSIEYGQLIIEANSDAEGPILAHLVSGPLAGSRMLGTFKKEDEWLVLTFNTIVIDGIAHSTEAVALDPETTSIAMVTDIDRRYFRRVILPAAAAFVEGMGEAIAETNQTTVVVDGGSAVSNEEELDSREEFFKGFEKATEKVGEILDEDADEIEPLIRVEAGTPIGLLFVAPVTDEAGS